MLFRLVSLKTQTTRRPPPVRRKSSRRFAAEEMVSFLKALVYGAGGMVVAGVAALVAFQERLVYVPALPGLDRSYPITPSGLRLDYEEVWLWSSDGVRLHAWFVKHDRPLRGTTLASRGSGVGLLLIIFPSGFLIPFLWILFELFPSCWNFSFFFWKLKKFKTLVCLIWV